MEYLCPLFLLAVVRIQSCREKKLVLRNAISEDIVRLEAEVKELETRSIQNGEDSDAVRQEMKDIIAQRAQTEASKTKAEREAQEKNKDILNMERACALLEQKKLDHIISTMKMLDIISSAQKLI